MGPMDLYLRKVIHPQATDSYRVLLKTDDGAEIEIGSIRLGLQHNGLDVGHRHRDPNARRRRSGPWQGPRGLHETVSRGMGAVQR